MSDTILTVKTLESKSQEDDENENVNVNENENENVNDETLMSSDKDDDYDDENKNENENEDDDESKQNNKRIKWSFRWNNWQIKIIWRANKIVKKREDLKGYWPYNDYDDKELKSKYFKIELADMSNEIDKKLFEQIFGHTLETLANKLINTTNKKENQIIVKNINNNKNKLYEMDFLIMIMWSNQVIDVLI